MAPGVFATRVRDLRARCGDAGELVVVARTASEVLWLECSLRRRLEELLHDEGAGEVPLLFEAADPDVGGRGDTDVA